MELTAWQVIEYILGAAMATSLLYLGYGRAITKYVKDYAAIERGKAHISSALSWIFWLVVLWLVAVFSAAYLGVV